MITCAVGVHDAEVGSMFDQLRRMVRAAIRPLPRGLGHRDGWIVRGSGSKADRGATTGLAIMPGSLGRERILAVGSGCKE
jgi:hypothetical protein